MDGLYPLKFKPRWVEKIWGGRKIETVLGKSLPPGPSIGESWELYDFPPGVIEPGANWVSAEIANGPLAGQTLHQAIEDFGRGVHGDVPLVGPRGQFPALVKFLDARQDLSVQVHPDASYAASHPEAHLKSEAWYVIQGEPGSVIYKGLKPGTTAEQFRAALESGRVMEHVRAVPVKAGHCHYLPSGTLHALGAGLLVAEVQTPSDTTFRVYDFGRLDESSGRPRPLHVEQAMRCIDFSGKPPAPQRRDHVAGLFTTVSRLATCEYFQLEKVRFTEGVEEPVPYDQPVVWVMLEGRAEVRVTGLKEPTRFTRGDTVLLPAAMRNPIIKTLSDCVWLEVTFPGHANP